MLPKSRRISRKEFMGVQSAGRRYNSTHFGLYVAKNKDNPNITSKFSFSVSKKVSKKASSRNTLRRRGYSIIQNKLNKIGAGFFVMFSFKKGAESLEILELDKEITELLYNSGVLS